MRTSRFSEEQIIGVTVATSTPFTVIDTVMIFAPGLVGTLQGSGVGRRPKRSPPQLLQKSRRPRGQFTASPSSCSVRRGSFSAPSIRDP